ncbi:hypothetical protein CcCBS67573_g09107 [Chytriomyces confervae]|uniref:Uncharacterized protein n=1 Tax=Chytriomyces confervae TaxID=246404 RepID=A0A507E7Q2_9FUNG|nr:hypothetical protein CcCBS67573_g09107 [Chytriomyces confervae]
MGGSALTDSKLPSKPDAHGMELAKQSVLPEYPDTHTDHADTGCISMPDIKSDASDARNNMSTEEQTPSKYPEARSGGALDVSGNLMMMMDDDAQRNAGGYSGDHQLLRLSKDDAMFPKFPAASGASISERDQSENVEDPGIRNWLSKEFDSAPNSVHQPPTDGNIDGCTVQYFTSRRRLLTLAMKLAGAEQLNRFDIRGSEMSNAYQEPDLNLREMGSEVKAANLGSDDAPAANRRVLRPRDGIADTVDRSRSSSKFSPLCDGDIDDQDKQCPDAAEDSNQTPGKSTRLRKRLEQNQSDGIHWSPSRAFGPFLLYRQVELTNTNEPHPIGPKYAPKRVQSNVAALEPTFSARTLKPNTRLVENGLTKRTITLKGSDGQKHRVVSYYCPDDVVEMSRLEAESKAGGSSSRTQQSDAFSTGPDEIFQRPMGDSRLCAIAADKSVNLTTLLALSVSNSFNGDDDIEKPPGNASNESMSKRVADRNDDEDDHDRQSLKRTTAQKVVRDDRPPKASNNRNQPEHHPPPIQLQDGLQSHLNPPPSSSHSFSHPPTYSHHPTPQMGMYPFPTGPYPLNHQPGHLPLLQPTQPFHGMPIHPASMYQQGPSHLTYAWYYGTSHHSQPYIAPAGHQTVLQNDNYVQRRESRSGGGSGGGGGGPSLPGRSEQKEARPDHSPHNDVNK